MESEAVVPVDLPLWHRGEPAEITRSRLIRLAFRSSSAMYDAFVQALLDVTPAGTSVILRGSGVTGRRWSDALPFDADGRGSSDLDITFVGGGMHRRWRSFYLPWVHTVPLSDEHPGACPDLVGLRGELCRLAGRPVNLQATRRWLQVLRNLIMNQPTLVLIDRRERRIHESSNESGQSR
jgi:hypothetical protein